MKNKEHSDKAKENWQDPITRMNYLNGWTKRLKRKLERECEKA
jgi:hypothetical protein